MGEANQTNAAELSPAAAMFQLIDGFRVSRTIYIAAKLELADLLKDGPRMRKLSIELFCRPRDIAPHYFFHRFRAVPI